VWPADPNVPDPTGIITKGKAKVNENSTKYDGRTKASVHDLTDLSLALRVGIRSAKLRRR
jgi:hypothetical protein